MALVAGADAGECGRQVWSYVSPWRTAVVFDVLIHLAFPLGEGEMLGATVGGAARPQTLDPRPWTLDPAPCNGRWADLGSDPFDDPTHPKPETRNLKPETRRPQWRWLLELTHVCAGASFTLNKV